MHIGFDAKRYFLNATGLGNYSRTTVRILHTYFPTNHYYLYTPRTSNRFDVLEPGPGIHERTPRFPLGRTFSPLWRTWLLGRETARDSLDIFHGLSHEIPYGLPRATRKVVTMHDLIFLRHPELYNRLDVAVYTAKYRSSCHRADRIIAISQQTKRDLVEFFNMDASRITVVYQSCDKRFYDRVGDDERQTIRKNHNLPLHYILYVGSLAQRKNVLTLIHALERIPRDSRPHLVLVGTGNRGYMSQLHEAIARADMAGDITWLGQVPGRDLPGIYQMADLFVYPSLFEGFGIPILEALFSKTPVITSTGSCFREAGGPHCLYTTPGRVDELSTAITRVLDDSTLAATMRDKGYEYALHFHEHQVATNMMNVYTSLLA